MSCVLPKDLKRFAQMPEKEGCLRFARILDISISTNLAKIDLADALYFLRSIHTYAHEKSLSYYSLGSD
jgi:hypothetical protein